MPGKNSYEDDEQECLIKKATQDIACLQMDNVTYLLAILISLYETDRRDTLNPKQILQIQSHFKRLLFQYLQTQMGAPYSAEKYDQFLKVFHDIKKIKAFVDPIEE